jgi:hypothetical protein
MKKLTLSLDTLEVQSFTTAHDEPGRGTVHGEQQCTCPTNCTCPGCPTCAETCPNTCWNTCDDPSCEGSCMDTCWLSCGQTCPTGFCDCNQSDFGSCIC